jgi:hypothetical protein
MATADGNNGNRRYHLGCFAEDDVHADGKRSNEVLLRAAEERKAVLQAREEGSRKVLLQRDVAIRIASVKRVSNEVHNPVFRSQKSEVGILG